MIAILCLPVLLLVVGRVAFLAFGAHVEPPERPSRLAWMGAACRISGSALLAGGIIASAFVYTHTEPGPGDNDDVIGYEISADGARPLLASQSRARHAQLEASGGNYDVLTDEVVRWLARRWHGRNLATTLLVLSVGGFVVLFYFARWF
jgi:hypothetical protein